MLSRHLVLAGLFLSASPLLAADNAKKPNILFCFADDWGRYASIYAKHEKQPSPNQVVKTPNFDAVAERGALFRRAYVNAPSCTPCRSALLSGRYFFNTDRGAILNGAVWDLKIPTYPLMLLESGYELGKIAKVWSPGSPADAGYGGQKYAFQKSGMKFNSFSQSATASVKAGKSVAEAKQELLNQVQGNFDSFLKSRDANKPFCFWFGPTNVHRKWIQGSGKALWNINPDDLKGKLPKFLADEPIVREDFADYLGEAQAFDAMIGVLIQQLKDAGELDNTWIVISGDHGAPGFPGGKCNLYDFGVNVALAVAGPGCPGGRVIDDFVNLMDLAPTFLDMGGVKPAPGMNGKSLLPVLTSTKSGQVDPTRNYVITGRERHVGDARAGSVPYPQRALRTDKYLYIRNFEPDRWPMGDPNAADKATPPPFTQWENNTRIGYADMDASPAKAWLIEQRTNPTWKWHYDYAFGKRPAEELYEIASDPDQVKNLASDPNFAKIKEELATDLMKKLREVGDPRIVEKAPCRFERSPYADPEAPAKKK